MADRSGQLVLHALSQAAATGGAPLHPAKGVPGLFPTTALGKQAARRCQDEGYLRPRDVMPPPPTGGAGVKKARVVPLWCITDKGLAHLLREASPRQLLEDLVRVLEGRQAQVDELLALARRMDAVLGALKAHADKVLHHARGEDASSPGDGGGLNALFRHFLRGDALVPAGAGDVGADGSNGRVHPPPSSLPGEGEAPVEPQVLARLGGWQGAGAGEDCPLPELFRLVRGDAQALTVGRFHDALRRLHETGQVYLHPWTGPLYDIPEPPYALLVGHEVAYYASARK